MTTVRLGALADLPPVIDGKQLAELLGCSYWAVLEMVKRDQCPVPPIRIGKLIRFPTAAVLRVLGVELDGAGAVHDSLVDGQPVTVALARLASDRGPGIELRALCSDNHDREANERRRRSHDA